MVTEGYMSAVKSALITHIIAADSELTSSNVLPSWDEDVWNYEDFPVVTVRIGPATNQDLIHGRQIGGGDFGNHVMYFFTAHVFEDADSTGDKSKSAMDLADKIKSKLLKSDDSASGIIHYEGITLRESPTRSSSIAKVIIEGYIFVRRPLTP